MTRHVICLDGTLNVQEDTTNVWRMHAFVDTNDGRQTSYYDHGIGTKWYMRGVSGIFGVGVEQEMREAYNWLVQRYRSDDEVFIFGFSRGAFAALCLANLIDRFGIIKPQCGRTFREVYSLYRHSEITRSSEAATRFRTVNSHVFGGKAQIQFLGLWDNEALGRELLGHKTSPLIEIAAKRFGVDIVAPVVDGDGAMLLARRRPARLLGMAGFEINDGPGVPGDNTGADMDAGG